MSKRTPCQTKLKFLLHYEESTGLLTWKERGPAWFSNVKTLRLWNAQHAGQAALNTLYDGYKRGLINGSFFRAHRIIWKLVYGTEPDQIDHINGDRADNRLENLRNVSGLENCRNLPISASNKSGCPGVSWKTRDRIWQSKITVQGRVIHLGSFRQYEAAVSARKAAEARFGFHPNHGRIAKA